MHRLARHLLLALSTVIAQVVAASGSPPAPATVPTCCHSAQACAGHRPASGPEQPARDCAACLPGSANCCLAVLTAPDRPAAPYVSVARLDSLTETGLQRNGPPPLPPPRRPA